jgi:hypothetical protein
MGGTAKNCVRRRVPPVLPRRLWKCCRLAGLDGVSDRGATIYAAGYGPMVPPPASHGPTQAGDGGCFLGWVRYSLGRWTIPANRSNNGRTHLVHLSESAVAIFNQCSLVRQGPLLCTTTGTTPNSGFSKAKERVDALSGVGGWTIHDLR